MLSSFLRKRKQICEAFLGKWRGHDSSIFLYFFGMPICTVPQLSFTCKNFCNNCLPDLSINMVATHAHTHRDEAITLKILLIMLFHNAQNFVWLCLRWSLIMPKLIHIAYIQVEDCPLFYASRWCQQVYRVFCLSNNETMDCWQVELLASME